MRTAAAGRRSFETVHFYETKAGHLVRVLETAEDGSYVAFPLAGLTKDDPRVKAALLKALPEFSLHRFLQHVLPQGLQRIRHFGFLSAAAKTTWQRVLTLLDFQPPPIAPPVPIPPPQCPCCKKPMLLIGLLPRAPPGYPHSWIHSAPQCI